VGSGDGHLKMSLHETGLHFPPAQDLAPCGPGRGQLGIVILYRGGVHYHLGLAEVLRTMSQKDPDSEPLETSGDGAVGHIGAADLVALTHQELGQAAHADAADADEVVALFRLACHSPQNFILAVTGANSAGSARLPPKARNWGESIMMGDSRNFPSCQYLSLTSAHTTRAMSKA
jgi:hypothetical protein